MSEGTQKPTPKRQKEFRKRGEVAQSKDLTAVAMLGSGAIAAGLYAHRSGGALTDLARTAAAAADGKVSSDLAGAALHSFLVAAGPAVIGAAVGATVAGLAQLGWPPVLKAPSIDLSRLIPGQTLREAWSPRAAARRAGIAAAKITAVGLVVALIVRSEASRGLEVATPGAIAGRISAALGRVTLAALFALAALAAGDYLLARRRLQAKMKMTPDEIRREMRESEGDPQLKGRRRRKARELARRRLKSEVQAADVVVVNPTHYAVALRYDVDKDAAPRVVARGADEAAAKIREYAREAGVPILSRPPLARALYKVPEGKTVPAPLFRGVAEVLAYVYRFRRTRAKRRAS
ncbi:MAG: EscU/YscU/HrcU family type III secretion system export apparatus switch protein [Deltaproteobacteria bacterium]|nr:EscU/YscU/HrcU family type III secretion system export apparatus switch protein [Deltaproteobacteria bacterium]